jgi:hypothetical protein
MLGWVYYPAQVLPEFGGLHLSQIPDVIWDGASWAGHASLLIMFSIFYHVR